MCPSLRQDSKNSSAVGLTLSRLTRRGGVYPPTPIRQPSMKWDTATSVHEHRYAEDKHNDTVADLF